MILTKIQKIEMETIHEVKYVKMKKKKISLSTAIRFIYLLLSCLMDWKHGVQQKTDRKKMKGSISLKLTIWTFKYQEIWM